MKNMDLAIPLFFYLLAFVFFFIALFEERDMPSSDEEEEKSDLTVMVLLMVTTILMFSAGITMLFVTETYYDIATDTYAETGPDTAIQPFAWIGIGLGVFCAYLTANKILIIFDRAVLE